jgi:hypothetical protein
VYFLIQSGNYSGKNEDLFYYKAQTIKKIKKEIRGEDLSLAFLNRVPFKFVWDNFFYFFIIGSSDPTIHTAKYKCLINSRG